MEDLGEEIQPKLRKYEKIPIYIVEYHNDVLPFIYRAIGSRHLPLKDQTFLHFDSHPDMLISRHFPAKIVYEKEKLFEELSIENWIMPAVYGGHFKNLIWVKPAWAQQLAEGSREFSVGEEKGSGYLKVDSMENYFLTDCLFVPKEKLVDAKVVNLEVVTLGKEIENQADDFQEISKTVRRYIKDDTHYVLDIDLDFFSTHNPFKIMYAEADMYENLKKIYKFDWPKTSNVPQLIDATERRQKQLDELADYFKHLQEHRELPKVEQPSELYTQVEALQKKFLEVYKPEYVDYELVHDAGCTYDETELPDHASTKEELDIMFGCFRKFLDMLDYPPTVITISRSNTDDYTPDEDVEVIQKTVLEMLHARFKCDEPVLKYQEDCGEK